MPLVIKGPSGAEYNWDGDDISQKDLDQIMAYDKANAIKEHQKRADFEVPGAVESAWDGAKEGLSRPLFKSPLDITDRKAWLGSIPESKLPGVAGGTIDALNAFAAEMATPANIGMMLPVEAGPLAAAKLAEVGAPALAKIATMAKPLALSYFGAEGLKGTAEGIGAGLATQMDPNATVKEKTVAAVMPALSGVMTAGIASGGGAAGKQAGGLMADVEAGLGAKNLNQANASANEIATKKAAVQDTLKQVEIANLERQLKALEGKGKEPPVELKAPMEFAGEVEPTLQEQLAMPARKTPKATDVQKSIESKLGIGEKAGIDPEVSKKLLPEAEIEAEAARRNAADAELAKIEESLGVRQPEGRKTVDAAEKTALADQLREEAAPLFGIKEGPEPTLFDMVGENVKMGDVQGKLIQTEDGSYAVMPEVQEAGKPTRFYEVPKSKEPGMTAREAGVIPMGKEMPVKGSLRPESAEGVSKPTPESQKAVKAKETAPVEFLGRQDDGKGGSFELWNLTKPIPGHPEGSTLSRQTLEGYGFKVPKAPESGPAKAPKGISGGKMTSQSGSILVPGEGFPTPKELKDAAESQRGIPESTMLRVVFRGQEGGTPAVFNDLLEHTGDLAHRLQEYPHQGSYAGPKIEKLKRLLWPKRGYMGLEQEIEYGINNNAIYRVVQNHPELQNGRMADAFGEALRLYPDEIAANKRAAYDEMIRGGKEYAEAHEQHSKPVTEAGRLGKEAAIALGEMDFTTLRDVVEKLDRLYQKHAGTDRIYQRQAPPRAEKGVSGGKMTSESGSVLVPGPSPKVESTLSPSTPADLANEQLKPILPDGFVSKAFQNIRPIMENVYDVLPRAAGAIRDMMRRQQEIFIESEGRIMPGISAARKALGREKFDELYRRLRNGDEVAALTELANGTPAEVEAAHSLLTWIKERDAVFQSHQATFPGKDIGYVENYWPTKVSDLEGLRKAMGVEDSHALDKALNQAVARKRKVTKDPNATLTPEEEGRAISELLKGSRQFPNQPGYLKNRTIKTIEKGWEKYFEPLDVAMEDHLVKISKDIAEQEFLGRVDTTQKNPWVGESTGEHGKIGAIIAEAIRDGSLDSQGKRILLENINALVGDPAHGSALEHKVSRAIGTVQTATNLNQLTNALRQLTDAFMVAFQTSPQYAAKGFAKAAFKTEGRVKLEDVGLHEGNADVAEFARNSGFANRLVNFNLKANLFQFFDQLGKEGLLTAHKAFAEDAARAMKGADSNAAPFMFKKGRQQYKAMHGEAAWNALFDDLKNSKELTPDIKRYLFDKISDAQPVTRAEMAKGKLQAAPLGQIPFRLMSFSLRQMGLARRNVIVEWKRGNKADAARWATRYLLWTMLGNSVVQYAIDLAQGQKQIKTEDYLFGGVLQMFGLNKYMVQEAAQGQGKALFAERIAPGVWNQGSAVLHDIGLARDMARGQTWASGPKKGYKVAPTLGSAIEQSETVKYFPTLGRIYYGQFGAGAARTKRDMAKEAAGHGQKSLRETIQEAAWPSKPKSPPR